MRSPQIAQVAPDMGWIEARHSSQTGRREILINGALQRQQLPGKSVANKLSAALPIHRANRLPLAAVLAPEARVGSSLLLKTGLPHPRVLRS